MRAARSFFAASRDLSGSIERYAPRYSSKTVIGVAARMAPRPSSSARRRAAFFRPRRRSTMKEVSRTAVRFSTSQKTWPR